MLVSEIKEDYKKRIGNGPSYSVIMDDDKVSSLIDIQTLAVQPAKEVFAYGYDQGDGLEYLPSERLDEYFKELNEEGVYEIYEDGEVTFVDMDTVMYYLGEGKDVVVNGKPIKIFIEEEMQRRVSKSNELR